MGMRKYILQPFLLQPPNDCLSIRCWAADLPSLPQAQIERDVLDFGKEIERSPEEWAMEWERELALAKVCPTCARCVAATPHRKQWLDLHTCARYAHGM